VEASEAAESKEATAVNKTDTEEDAANGTVGATRRGIRLKQDLD
jgi:hypothetical protein